MSTPASVVAVEATAGAVLWSVVGWFVDFSGVDCSVVMGDLVVGPIVDSSASVVGFTVVSMTGMQSGFAVI